MEAFPRTKKSLGTSYIVTLNILEAGYSIKQMKSIITEFVIGLGNKITRKIVEFQNKSINVESVKYLGKVHNRIDIKKK